MRGRQVLMDSLVAHGAGFIFGNPGTTESPLLDSLSGYPGIQYITALHESVATCAASFYAQASGKTGIVNLHVAPGLGNAIGMMYGALRSTAPLIVTAGQQDTRIRLKDPVLGHDLVAMAAPVTKWSVQVERADEMALIMRRAFKIANDAPAGPVFVALPIDVMEQDTGNSAQPPGESFQAGGLDATGVGVFIRSLLAANRPVIVCGDDVARSGAGPVLVRLAEAIGAGVWWEGIRQHDSFPTAHPNARGALPLEAGGIAKALAGADTVLLIGGPFFEDIWHAPGDPFPPGAKILQLEPSPVRLAHNFSLHAGVAGDLARTLHAITVAVASGATPEFGTAAVARNQALAALKEQERLAYRARAQKAWDRSPISMPRVMAEIKAALPPQTILVDETITASLDLARTFSLGEPGDFTNPGDCYGCRGGGIGQGLAGALGVKIAHPARPVVCLSGDGSAMYSIQALWTAAHHNLGIVFVILANREYRVLKHNLDIYRQLFDVASNRDYPNMDLTGPDLGFVAMAAGMGVTGVAVTIPGEIRPAIEAGLRSGKPYVVEIAIEGKK